LNLNYSDEQKQSIFAPNDRVLVSACPGAGKTAVLTERIAQIVKAGFNPKEVCAMTFTKKAAEEMRTRLIAKLGEKARDLRIGTIHSICLKIIKYLSNTYPEIANQDEISRAIQKVADETKTPVREVQSIISREKSRSDTDRDNDEEENPYVQMYQAELGEYIDFDDILIVAAKLLNTPEWHRRVPFRHILVDECQDLNPIQKTIIDRLVAPVGHTLYIVGDPDQSIYGFRGANPTLFSEFNNITKYRLSKNFRSGGIVVNRCSRLATDTYEPASQHNGRVEWFRADSNEHEMELLIERIKKEPDYNKVAILTRTNGHALELALTLREAGIPVLDEEDNFNLERFYGLRAVLQLMQNPKGVDFKSFSVAAFGMNKFLGKSFRAAIQENMKKFDCTPWEAMEKKLAKPWMNYRARDFKNLIRELRDVYRRTEDLQVVVREAAVRSDFVTRFHIDEDELVGFLSIARGKKNIPQLVKTIDDITKSMEDGIHVITAHRSKGLEFDTVYVPRINNGVYPHKMADSSEEERRLLFVAITRAERKLVLSWNDNDMSPFIEDLGLELETIKKKFWIFKTTTCNLDGCEGDEEPLDKAA
jgi:superfamily I DNA/RNA helicase